MSKCIRCSQKALEPGVVVEGGTVLIRALNFLYTCWLLCLDHLPASGAHLEHTFISHLGRGGGGGGEEVAGWRLGPKSAREPGLRPTHPTHLGC